MSISPESEHDGIMQQGAAAAAATPSVPRSRPSHWISM